MITKKSFSTLIFALAFSWHAWSSADLKPFSQASVSADAALIQVQKEDLQKLLPPYLTLARQKAADTRMHPVFIIFSTHSGSKVIGDPSPGFTYQEVLVFVPYVKRTNGKRVFNYMSQIYLNELIPTYFGLSMYGYKKTWATVNKSDEQYTVTDKFIVDAQGHPLVTYANMSKTHVSTYNRSRFIKNWKQVAAVFDNPVISNVDGVELCSKFHFTHNNMLPVDLKISLFGAFKGMPVATPSPTEPQLLTVSGATGHSVFGGYHYDSDYELTLPGPAGICE